MTETSSHQSGTHELAQRIDDAVSDELLVVGSAPGGRDLDLMAPRESLAKLAAWLESSGFANHGHEWVRFHACSAEAIDLLSPAAFGLDDDATADLFRDAQPLAGFRHIARPAPHHLLLMLARWTAEGNGILSDKRRARIAQLLDQDPDAWSNAELRAEAWRASRSLAALRRVYATSTRLTRRERAAALAESVYSAGRTPSRARLRASVAACRPRSRHRGRLVSFSGLDGAGKSSQVEALRQAI